MVGCGHVFGLERCGTMTAGHDEIRGSSPYQHNALCAHGYTRVFSILGSTELR